MRISLLIRRQIRQRGKERLTEIVFLTSGLTDTKQTTHKAVRPTKVTQSYHALLNLVLLKALISSRHICRQNHILLEFKNKFSIMLMLMKSQGYVL